MLHPVDNELPYVNELDRQIDQALSTFTYYADLTDHYDGYGRFSKVYVWKRVGPSGMDSIPEYSTRDPIALLLMEALREKGYMTVIQFRPADLTVALGVTTTHAVVISHPEMQRQENNRAEGYGTTFAEAASQAAYVALRMMGMVEGS